MPRALPTALAVALVLAAAAAFWHQHTAPLAPVVLPPASPVRLLGSEPWFHARHGWLGAQGELRRFDPQGDFPRGLRAVHVGGFDALLARVAQGAEDREAAFARLAWVPPALGVLCLLGVAGAAGWAGGAGGAVLAAGLLLGWPGDYGNRADLGAVAPPVIEPLLGLAALALLAVWLARERPPGPWALAAVVALWLLLLTWASAPLWIGVLVLAVLAQVWGELPEDSAVAQRAALWATLSAAGYAIVGARWPNVPLVGPLVAPSVAALGGAATALGVWSKWGRRLSPSSRRGALVALAGAALAGAWLWPGTGTALHALLTPGSPPGAEHGAF
ncbi:MAG: hypothetical protein KC613_12395, partial [Myxococcales bacterium]|nr:hypothetical protein [Myxococcales bacterium]